MSKVHACHVDKCAVEGIRTPVVETSLKMGEFGGARWFTHARVRLEPLNHRDGFVHLLQEVSATITGAGRRQALQALYTTLCDLQGAVQRAIAAEPDAPFDPACRCHACCTLSCCNPTIAPAMVPAAP